MIGGKVVWQGDDAEAEFQKELWERLVRMTEFTHAKMLQELNISNPRPYVTPSAPGEPPRKRTGFLQGNVQREYDQPGLRSRIGVMKNAIYGIFLDLGTWSIQSRPWLFATVKKYWAQLQAIAKG